MRGIERPFKSVSEDCFLKAFNEIVGSKNTPSPGESALIERARRYAEFLRFFPGIRRIWVCNSLSMNAADADSDIDLFIETAPGGLWTGRVSATAFFSLLGVRRHGNKVARRFCLSFFAVENANLGKLAIENDAYLYEWARRLVPVDGSEEIPRGIDTEGFHEPQKIPSILATFFLGMVERTCKFLFEKRTVAEYERLGKPWGIVISDEFLKFHPEDRRMEIRDAVERKLAREKR